MTGPTAIGDANSVTRPAPFAGWVQQLLFPAQRLHSLPVGQLVPVATEPSTPAVSGSVAGNDVVFQAIVNGLNAPPSVQLPAMYPGGSTTVTPGTPGSRGPLLLAVLLAGGLGVWWFKSRKGA